MCSLPLDKGSGSNAVATLANINLAKVPLLIFLSLLTLVCTQRRPQKVLFRQVDHNKCLNVSLFQAKASGKILFEQVCKQLNLLETDYFGLEYNDHKGATVRSYSSGQHNNLKLKYCLPIKDKLLLVIVRNFVLSFHCYLKLFQALIWPCPAKLILPFIVLHCCFYQILGHLNVSFKLCCKTF